MGLIVATSKRIAPRVRNQDSLFESEARSVVADISKTAIVGGRLIKGVTLGPATYRVPHSLGRPYLGWFVVDQTAPASVYRDTADANRPQEAIPLAASAAVTVNLWVF